MSTDHVPVAGPVVTINGAPLTIALCAACRCVAHMCPHTQNAHTYTEATQ